VASTPISLNRFPVNLPPARAESLIILDATTGQTLAQKNADTRRAVASTQKLLTALVVLESGSLRRNVVIQPEDTRVEPSKLYLKAGDVYSREQLLKGCLIKSANDAALALARDTAGSVPAFAQRMNSLARRLGATSSNFINPHGLTTSGQYSTARDMARIAYAASRNPFIRRTVNQVTYTFNTPRGPKPLKNTNKLLGSMSACTGMKTGYTRASGRCLVTSASLGRRNVILVQLGSETKYIFDDAERLMIWSSSQQSPSGGTYAHMVLAEEIPAAQTPQH
jgi:D-alanyl-D-alanine carboxypeptidase (penicillin-binding protein 5/6)